MNGRALRLAVVGASGRMGRAVVRIARGRGHSLVCAVAASDLGRDAGELAGEGAIGVAVTDRLDAVASCGADVVVDFSGAVLTSRVVEVAIRAKAALVSGTTGLGQEATAAITAASTQIAVLWEPNMSVGVHVLGELVRAALERLGVGVDVEILEAHHRRKVDAPSGTALRLAEIAASARGGAAFVHGRHGRPGERPAGEIGLHALRGGDVVGDHSVHLLGDGERLELVHRASSRDVFAHGALRAAEWIAGKPAGRYTLADVLG